MTRLSKYALTAALAGLLAAASALAEPSFKTGKNKDTEDFCKEVFNALIKATRTDPREITLTKYAYATLKNKKDRKTLTLNGYFKGSITKKKFTEKWTLYLDTNDPKEWEVLKVEVETSHPAKPKQKYIDKAIKDLNR